METKVSRYNSTEDSDPQIFVIYKDAQMYPELIVLLKQWGTLLMATEGKLGKTTPRIEPG